jgi:hypothetical protein
MSTNANNNMTQVQSYDYETETENDFEDEEDYNYFPNDGKCRACYDKLGKDNLLYIEFDWDVIPRLKDIKYKRYQDILGLYLCHFCHKNCKEFKTCGWDKWAALDVLEHIPKKNKSVIGLFYSKL